MIKQLHKIIVSFLLLLFSINQISAQLQKGQLVDGIAAVVGNEIILESDLDEQINYARQQGTEVPNKCEFLENLVSNKLLIFEAKRDTLIESRTKEIRDQAEKKYQSILSQFPDERTMLSTYKFRNAYEMKNAIEKIDTDQYYGQMKYSRVTDKVDVTPNEVTDFYNTYQNQLPSVKDEVVLSQISVYPKLTDKHRQELIDKLKKIRQDILNGESFETQARIYSEDEGSAANGGLYKNIAKGRMVKAFEATALNLQEDEISEPVETEFGFHIIQLLKKSGKMYDARHILLKSEPTPEEIATARNELQNIRQQILDGKITFKEAAYKYSDDKNTKFNGGTLTGEDGSDKIEKLNLPATLGYQIAGMNKGDITDVFQDEMNRRKVVTMVKIEDVIPAHQLQLSTDYERVKALALGKKKNEVLEKWVKERIPHVFISINDRYKDCSFKTEWTKNNTAQ